MRTRPNGSFFAKDQYTSGSVTRDVFGPDIIKALGNWNFRRVDQRGDHVKLRYVDPNTGEKRTVIVPLHDELETGTLRSIAEQAGADDFQKFLDEIDKII